MSHFVALKRMYEGAPINKFFAPSISVTEGTAVVRMTVTKAMHHAAHAAHGAVYFKMLDDAAFFAAQSLVTDAFVLTASFNLHLLAPVVDGEMVATGKVVHDSKRLLIAESVLEVAGKVVARGSGTFMKGSTRLSEDLGYT